MALLLFDQLAILNFLSQVYQWYFYFPQHTVALVYGCKDHALTNKKAIEFN